MHRETYSTPNLSPPLVGHTFAAVPVSPLVLSITTRRQTCNRTDRRRYAT